jgi:hypothetical protein
MAIRGGIACHDGQFTGLKGSRHYPPWRNSHAPGMVRPTLNISGLSVGAGLQAGRCDYNSGRGDDMTKPPDREVLLEFQRVGSYMKATAMDAATLTEVSVVGPLNHSQEMLRRTVLAKLDYVLAKKAGTPPRR